MKRFLKTFGFILLSVACLATATACANKSECNVPEQNEQTVTNENEIEPLPECPDCPPDPECPEIPEEPNDDRDKSDEDRNDNDRDDEGNHIRPVRPYPIRRRIRVKLFPIEIYFGEQDGQPVYFIIFPSDI